MECSNNYGASGLSNLEPPRKPPLCSTPNLFRLKDFIETNEKGDFSGSAAPGWCAAKSMKYFGYKLVLLATWQGVPIAYDQRASQYRRTSSSSWGSPSCPSDVTSSADIGFISASWLDELDRSTGNRVWTAHRANQHQQHSAQLNRFISRIRQRVEGVFHEIGEYWT
ncbi:hypothetical protein BJP36_28245 [Moorena producens JHB]|uniref:Uncharacterized protein n=1 Tax=Moorena producens (strain JHB) TaxID=1454205 RepID=A0A1D9G6M4_MOOP1|nr:hypothetical protein [Moorena producens]AOY83233.2 hypothetical protein BJP36_28245 [Moorena producens JHB]